MTQAGIIVMQLLELLNSLVWLETDVFTLGGLLRQNNHLLYTKCLTALIFQPFKRLNNVK